MTDRSILFPGGGMTLREMAALATRFDEAGFYALYCVEAYRSGFVPMTAIAGATRRAKVGSYILNAHARPPVAAAMAIRDLDEYSGGRVVVGVGSGNPHINEHHLGASNASALRTMREYVLALKMGVNAQPGALVEFEYADRSIAWVPALGSGRDDVPVYLAAMYPKMRRVAAEVADGIALGSLHSAEYVRQVIRPAAIEALSDSDRDPGKFKIIGSALTSVHSDRMKARLEARTALCSLFNPLPHPYYEFILREQGWSAMVDAVAEQMSEGRLEAAVELVSDEVVDELLIAGDAADCEAAIDKFEGALDEIILTDAASVGASITPGGTGALDGITALLDLAPVGALGE